MFSNNIESFLCLDLRSSELFMRLFFDYKLQYYYFNKVDIYNGRQKCKVLMEEKRALQKNYEKRRTQIKGNTLGHGGLLSDILEDELEKRRARLEYERLKMVATSQPMKMIKNIFM